ncbi:hypothetical protein LEP1GSC105_3263 [Leptospira interrogans str. UI 12758]|uniref:Uncharacterized protein n=1 Tax=Leptospira interrogans str. UI 12758 TaxID=1049938 RepID=A0A0E2D9R0_LEPIR|nr:hypothetical protein LEP1GSC105_3263 [Leptospira interrogans str. UI 12758]
MKEFHIRTCPKRNSTRLFPKGRSAGFGARCKIPDLFRP